METARIAETIDGPKLYQSRAREALPLLVRQAEAGMPMYYSALASELGMPNPRNLNYVLGSIGESLRGLSHQWKEEVPPIQCLVLNKQSQLPGNGISWFITNGRDFAKLPRWKKQDRVKEELDKIFAFTRWREVLAALHLQPAPNRFAPFLDKAASIRGGGESEEHRKFKQLVARHPEWLRLPRNIKTTIEAPLPSGDCVDVLFTGEHELVAAEVKSRLSPQPDLVRGLFQCVKYRAVLGASQAARGLPQNARAVLVLELVLPTTLLGLKNILGVEVLSAPVAT